jgi:hypothetical protein
MRFISDQIWSYNIRSGLYMIKSNPVQIRSSHTIFFVSDRTFPYKFHNSCLAWEPSCNVLLLFQWNQGNFFNKNKLKILFHKINNGILVLAKIASPALWFPFRGLPLTFRPRAYPATPVVSSPGLKPSFRPDLATKTSTWVSVKMKKRVFLLFALLFSYCLIIGFFCHACTRIFVTFTCSFYCFMLACTSFFYFFQAMSASSNYI